MKLNSLTKLKELERKKDDILKEMSQVDVEKEQMQRKVVNLSKSFRSKSPNMDNSVVNGDLSELKEDISDTSDLDLKRLKSNSKHYQLEDINSDIEKLSFMERISDCTSIASNSVISDTERSNRDTKEEISNLIDSKTNLDPKLMYKEFVKVFLKVKFENLHSQHRGQTVQQNLVWKEALRKNISRNQYEEFIIEELKNASKYSKMSKSKSPTKR